jgi:hypothetical protein
MAVEQHLLELERLLDAVPLCTPDGEGVVQFRLDHPGGRCFFSVRLGSDGHRLERRPLIHPNRQLSISGDFEDWMQLYRRPYAQKLGRLRFWGASSLLAQLLAPRAKKRSFLDVRCSREEW